VTDGRRVRAGVLATLLATLTLLTACGSGSGAGGQGGSTDAGGSAGQARAGGPGGVGGLATLLPSGTAGTTGPSSTDGGASPSTSSGASPSSTDASSTLTIAATELPYFFRTPSKNIYCAFDADEVRCDINQRVWQSPPKPASCEQDYGNGLFVGAGRAGYTCAGDTLLSDPNAVQLDYGKSVTVGDLTCLSQQAGVTCQNNVSGHGFSLSKEGHAPF
jgi:hypothetical protein